MCVYFYYHYIGEFGPNEGRIEIIEKFTVSLEFLFLLKFKLE
jgi:hypothetical protein